MKHRNERGSATLELVIVAPAALLILAAIIAAGRIALTQQAVQAVAYDTARAASIARNATEARAAATEVVAYSTAANNLTCSSTDLAISTTGFNQPVGTPAAVTTTMTCTVQLSDVALPGIPGAITIVRTGSSPIDTYRER